MCQAGPGREPPGPGQESVGSGCPGCGCSPPLPAGFRRGRGLPRATGPSCKELRTPLRVPSPGCLAGGAGAKLLLRRCGL